MLLLGLIFAWLYERTNNLLASITAHGVFNAVNILFFVVSGQLEPLTNQAIIIDPAMNEFELIEKLSRTLPGNGSLQVGAGDDCAVIDLGMSDKLILFKADAVVEGIHFTADTPPEKIGRKALARCLSDIAAMGGAPDSALITLALPRDFGRRAHRKIYAGLNELARRHGVAIAGGETVLNPERLLISVALLGTVKRGGCLLRRGAVERGRHFCDGRTGRFAGGPSS